MYKKNTQAGATSASAFKKKKIKMHVMGKRASYKWLRSPGETMDTLLVPSAPEGEKKEEDDDDEVDAAW